MGLRSLEEQDGVCLSLVELDKPVLYQQRMGGSQVGSALPALSPNPRLMNRIPCPAGQACDNLDPLLDGRDYYRWYVDKRPKGAILFLLFLNRK